MLHSVLGYISYHPLVHLKIGPLSISPHGVGIAVGFLCGARLMLPEANRKGIRDEQVYAMLTRAAIGAIIGAYAIGLSRPRRRQLLRSLLDCLAWQSR